MKQSETFNYYLRIGFATLLTLIFGGALLFLTSYQYLPILHDGSNSEALYGLLILLAVYAKISWIKVILFKRSQNGKEQSLLELSRTWCVRMLVVGIILSLLGAAAYATGHFATGLRQTNALFNAVGSLVYLLGLLGAAVSVLSVVGWSYFANKTILRNIVFYILQPILIAIVIPIALVCSMEINVLPGDTRPQCVPLWTSDDSQNNSVMQTTILKSISGVYYFNEIHDALQIATQPL